MFNHLSRWFTESHQRRRDTPKTRKYRPRPNLELLEDRLAPAIFNVNSLADILNPPAGIVTLRSAIQAANATPGGNTINLTLPGTYKITLPGTPGETDNAAGEFAILPAGGNLLIQNTSGGTALVDGNQLARVFDINPGNTDNPATKILVTMAGFTIQNGVAQPGDAAGGSGGGIRDQGNTSLTLFNMVVTNNIATADGGGISMENAPASTPWTLTINNSTISNNHAGDAGGGVETDGKGKVFINESVISGNTTLNQGAAVWLDATADGVASVSVTPPGGSGYGTTPPTVTFSAPQNAGGTTATGTANLTAGAVTSVTIMDPGSGYTAAPNVTFSPPPAGTTATGTANLGFNISANLTLTGDVVTNNSALNGPTGAIGNAGSGAVTIANSTVANNFSGSTGGGFGDENNLGTLTVLGSVFVGNTAVGNGGGIQEGGPSTTITNSLIQGNNSGLSGGGLFANGIALTISNSTFAGNIASGNSGTGANGNGGAIELETTGTSAITNTTITGNSAVSNTGTNGGTPQLGGGIDAPGAFTGTLTLLDDTINANFATGGGGIFWSGGPGTVTVQNTIIAKNTASTAGTDAFNPAANFTDNGGNLIGISGAGSNNSGFTAGTTQTGTTLTPLDPLLGPLAPNGGNPIGAPATPTDLATEMPLANSPAIDRGVLNATVTTDERGVPRPDSRGADTGLQDVGAFETNPLTGNAAFVQTLYYDFLNRLGDTTNPMDAGSWVNALNAGILTPQQVANAIGRSPEALGVVVDGLYLKILKRASDPNGRAGFVTFLHNGGTVEQAIIIMVTSPEFSTLSGGTDLGFVQFLYNELLGRNGSPLDVAGWVNALPSLGRAGVANAFLQSSEFRGDVVQESFGFTYALSISVVSTIPNLLHRTAAPSAVGINGWVNSGLDILSLKIDIAESMEFSAWGSTGLIGQR